MSASALAPATHATFGVARSFSGQRWVLRAADDGAVRALALKGNLSNPLARLLAGRGVSADELSDVLEPTLRRLLPEPRLLPDMDNAVARVQAAIESGERIAIFGDYDVDGSCSAALLHEFLSPLGVRPRIYIPDRLTEGYGPSAPALLQLKEEGAGLVITVDCGATAGSALTVARDSGLDVIVLDHHAVEDLPPSFAHVNPNRKDDASGLHHLCAAGVTFLFVVALNRALRASGWFEANGIAEPDLRKLVDLVGLATVCDVVPLVGVNRAFVRAGLARLGRLERHGLAALASVAGATPPFTSYHLGFVLGPRINAGGRVGRCSLGVDLLTARDMEAGLTYAQALDMHNRERQAIEKLILDEAVEMATLQHNAPYLFASSDGWHAGVVGIVAGRLKDRFAKPSFVAGFEGGLGRGSARSVAGIDVGAIVRAAKDAGVIESGGGHAMAAGFSLSLAQRERFHAFLATRFGEAGAALDAAITLDIDTLSSPSGATEALVRDLARAGPFGAGNPEPMVAVPDARVVFADVVGKDHVRLRLAGVDGARLEAIAFRAADRPLGHGLLASRGRTIHVAGRLRAEDWNGRTRVQLHVEDAAPANV